MSSKNDFCLGAIRFIFRTNPEPRYSSYVAKRFPGAANFQDLDGNELAHIEQKMLRWTPTYEIHRRGQFCARVTKEFSWFKKKFELDVPGPNDYLIEGSFWKHDYKFTRSSETVAWVSIPYWSWTDTYGVEVVQGEDDVTILSTVLVIDQVLHDDKNRAAALRT